MRTATCVLSDGDGGLKRLDSFIFFAKPVKLFVGDRMIPLLSRPRGAGGGCRSHFSPKAKEPANRDMLGVF